MSCSSSWRVSSQQSLVLFNVLKQEKFTDVSFLIGANETEFKANRIFLAMHSNVFSAMLYGAMQESKRNSEIRIPDISSSAFKSVLNYCYCNDPQLNSQNILKIKQICDKYQINGLSLLCDKYFHKCLNVENVCFILEESLQFKLDLYVAKCQEIINRKLGKSAKKIVQTLGFAQMGLNAMQIFLSCDNLEIKEENLWEAVVKWKNYQISSHPQKDSTFLNNEFGLQQAIKLSLKTAEKEKEKKRKWNVNEPQKKRQKLNNNNNKNANNEIGLELLKSICLFMRFGLMNGKYFVQQIKPLKILSDKQMNDILSYYQCKEAKCGDFCVKPRRKRRNNYNYKDNKRILNFQSDHMFLVDVDHGMLVQDRDDSYDDDDDDDDDMLSTVDLITDSDVISTP